MKPSKPHHQPTRKKQTVLRAMERMHGKPATAANILKYRQLQKELARSIQKGKR